MKSPTLPDLSIARHCLKPALRRRVMREDLAWFARHYQSEACWASEQPAPVRLTKQPWFVAACVVAHSAGVPAADIEAFTRSLRTCSCPGRDVSPAIRFAQYAHKRMRSDPVLVRQATFSRALAAFRDDRHRCFIRRSRHLPWRWLDLTDANQLDLFLDG